MLDNKWRNCAEDVRRKGGRVSDQLMATKELTSWLVSLPQGEITIPIDVQRKTKNGEWRFTRKNYSFSPAFEDVEAQLTRMMKYIAFELSRVPRTYGTPNNSYQSRVSSRDKELAMIELMTHIVVSELKQHCSTQAEFMMYCERQPQVPKESIYQAMPVYYTDYVVIRQHRTKERVEIENMQVSALLKGLKTLPKGVLIDELDGREFTPDDVLIEFAAKHFCNALLFYRTAPRKFTSSAELVDYVNTHIAPLGAFAQRHDA